MDHLAPNVVTAFGRVRLALEAAADAQPAAILVYGERGIGKSTLVSAVKSVRTDLAVVDDADRNPAAVAAAVRSVMHGNAVGLLAAASVPAAVDVSPCVAVAVAPLTPEEVCEVVRAGLGDATDGFCEAVAAATAGIPAYVDAVVQYWAGRGATPSNPGVDQLAATVRPETEHWILRRAATAHRKGLEVASAAVVLGHNADLHHVAAVANMPLPEVRVVADALVADDLFAPRLPIRARCPVVASALHNAIPPVRRAAMHDTAARRLAADGLVVPAATQLLGTDPLGEAWRVETLLSAADRTNVAQTRAIFLERALREPPAPEMRPDVLVRLGEAETAAFEPAAIDHLREAVESSSQRPDRYRAVESLVLALMHADRWGEARALLDRELPVRPDPRSLLPVLCMFVRWVTEHHRPPARGLAYAGRADTAAKAFLSWLAPMVGSTRQDGASMGRLALSSPHLAELDAMFEACAIWGLEFAEEYAPAIRHLNEGLGSAEATGDAARFVIALTQRGVLRYKSGDVREAELDAEGSLQLAIERNLLLTLPISVAVLANALVDRGEPRRASALLRQYALSATGATAREGLFHFVRGRALAADGDHEDAVNAFEACGRHLARHRHDFPTFWPWRSEMALSLLALGDRESASSYAATEFTLAERFGAVIVTASAGRALGLATDDVALLEHAADLHRASGNQHELARSLVAYGAALRRRHKIMAARRVLSEARGCAASAGAVTVETEAELELRAAGARPRRRAIRGVDALTASELRVARLAAGGLDNQAIASRLFVSVKTVEKHLTSAYTKLGIGRRSALSAVLPSDKE